MSLSWSSALHGPIPVGAAAGRHRRPRQTNVRPARFLARTLTLLAVLGIAFAACQAPVRSFETAAVAWSLRLLTVPGIEGRHENLLLIQPQHEGPLWIELTSSCSSLAPVLALAFVTHLLSIGRSSTRRWIAALIAMGTIALGNVLRIDASVIAGLFYGKASLVLFHDWVGSIFGFAYTLLGFAFMLAVLLPSRKDADAAVQQFGAPL